MGGVIVNQTIEEYSLRKCTTRRVSCYRLGRAIARPRRPTSSNFIPSTLHAQDIGLILPVYQSFTAQCTDVPLARNPGRATINRKVKILPNMLCMSNVPKARPYMVADFFRPFSFSDLLNSTSAQTNDGGLPPSPCQFAADAPGRNAVQIKN